MVKREDLIYDWNVEGERTPHKPEQEFTFADETLRDGLQSPSVKNPSIEEKKQILHFMEDLGIHTADIGLPGAGEHVQEEVRALAREIKEENMDIRPYCAARTLAADIEPIIEISEDVGIPIEVAAFIGSSPIRQYAEDWEFDRLLEHTEDAVRMCVKADLPVMYVTEDTTRAQPEDLKKLYKTAIEAGARRITLCDTVGHVIPEGVHNLIRFAREEIVEPSGEDVYVDFHGHNDRGLAVANTITALEAGADQVHACALGIGERIGNTPMDQLLVNLKLLGWIDQDLSELPEYCDLVAEAVGRKIPDWYPMIGKDAFETATGVHAAAVIKAIEKEDDWLADRVYSGVPANELGREQKIRIGPMSGKSNVRYWLESRDIEPDDDLVSALFEAGKNADRLLEEDEVWQLIREERGDRFVEEKRGVLQKT